MDDLIESSEAYRQLEASDTLVQALELHKKNPNITPWTLQADLDLGWSKAWLVYDWLVDNSLVEPRITKNLIRNARAYTLNNFQPNLKEMALFLRVRDRTASRLMIELQRRKIIRVRTDFSFERIKPAATFENLVRQMLVVAGKYRTRCDVPLLMRTMFIERDRAVVLSVYGATRLGLRPKKWRTSPSSF